MIPLQCAVCTCRSCLIMFDTYHKHPCCFAGGSANPDGVLRSYPLAAQHNSKPLDPRLVRLSQQSHHQQQQRARSMQHVSSDPRQRDPPAALPAASPALAAVNVDSVAQGQAAGEEEVGETDQHVTGVLPGANTSSASSSCKPLHHSNSLNCTWLHCQALDKTASFCSCSTVVLELYSAQSTE